MLVLGSFIQNSTQMFKQAYHGVRMLVLFVLAIVMGVQLVVGSNASVTTSQVTYKKLSTSQVHKQPALSDNILAVLETISDDDNDEDDKKTTSNTTYYLGSNVAHHLIAFCFSSAVQQRISYLEQAVSNRPTIPYFLLYHSWKSDLLLVS
jgi:hypothetical protein